jgi:hypothetical protein
MPTAG